MVDPRSYYGRPWNELQYHEQVELMAYTILRMEEKVPEDE
jgi:hypothetical protein